MRRVTCSSHALNDNVASFPCTPASRADAGLKPAGANHTHSHTHTHARLISENTVGTALIALAWLKTNKHGVFSTRRQAEAPPHKPNGGRSEKSELQATPLRFNGADGICIDPVNKKRPAESEGGRFRADEGTWGDCPEAKDEICRHLYRFHINAKSSKCGERLSGTSAVSLPS